MGYADSRSRFLGRPTSSHKKVTIVHVFYGSKYIFSFLSLIGHQSRQSKADIRILSTFFIGSSFAVMDYCPPVGPPEKDNELVYGISQNLNKIKYYQETIK